MKLPSGESAAYILYIDASVTASHCNVFVSPTTVTLRFSGDDGVIGITSKLTGINVVGSSGSLEVTSIFALWSFGLKNHYPDRV